MEKDLAYFVMLAESVMNEMRLQGKFEFADQIKKRLIGAGLTIKDISVKDLREWKEGYAKHRNMPDATLYELEIYERKDQ